MKLKKKHISICPVCIGEGYIEEGYDNGPEDKGTRARWCSTCNGHGYILRHDKKEELKAMALSIFEETE